jgi:hypothetical protein
MTITVIDVFRFMGHTPTPDQSWSVGARVASIYVDEFKHEPPKELRPKTSGGGSHCFAIYPSNYMEKIVGVVNEVVTVSAAQQSLFGDDA